MVTEQRKEEIRVEARAILERFGKMLSESKSASHKKASQVSTREEGSFIESNKTFREQLFLNALHKTSDFIVAEKAQW